MVNSTHAVRPDVLGIIAGGGQFPSLVAQGGKDVLSGVVAVGFKGYTNNSLKHEVDAYAELRMGQLSKLIRFFKKQGVTKVCLAGAISKPKVIHFRPDFRVAKLLFKITTKGDDALLRVLLNELESEGFAAVQAAEFVPTLRSPQGVLTSRKPSKEEMDDLRFGWSVAKEIGRLDIGQCVVVRSGIIAAVECMEGTDDTIKRGATLAGKGCVVVKTLKPGQDERVDLPALGAGTIQTLIDNKVTCLGYEAGKSLFFDLEQSCTLADKAGISIVGFASDHAWD